MAMATAMCQNISRVRYGFPSQCAHAYIYAYNYMRNEPKITTYHKPQKYHARRAAAWHDTPEFCREGSGPPANCSRIGIRFSAPKVPALKLGGCGAHARRAPDRRRSGGAWLHGQQVPYRSVFGHKMPQFLWVLYKNCAFAPERHQSRNQVAGTVPPGQLPP